MTQNAELSVKDLIDRYYSRDIQLLKHALTAKIEEDKKKVAEYALKIENAKVYLRQLDNELLKLPPIYLCTLPALSATQYHSQSTCTDYRNNNMHQSQRFHHQRISQPATPISPIFELSPAAVKRKHSSIDTGKNSYHHRVMKALREKITKGNSQYDYHDNKRKLTLPEILTQDRDEHELYSSKSVNAPSPSFTMELRLPPIDTRLNKISESNPPLSPIIASSSSSSSL